ncbi:MAG: outer membrane protein assembly factor BamD [Bdellovibrionaceae bacterium]|nr:outer membrane protein assembly factor BamD [Pseudobdellovibrionaceae bacterium]MDW8189565.1 outer membrane protein assembly factor BamD [Pseudobdellovibrionaceae bacterium]
MRLLYFDSFNRGWINSASGEGDMVFQQFKKPRCLWLFIFIQKSLRVGAPWLSLVLLIGACSSEPKKDNSPEEKFKLAEYYENEERFEEALRRYNMIRQSHPYSSVAVEAELKVADVYFKQENFQEARLAYEAFRDKHPRHPKSDYVLMQLALSIYNQLPETIDRDQSLLPEAVKAFDDLIIRFPSSSFVAEAIKKKEELQNRAIEKVKYIADFYFKRGAYLSALERYWELYQMSTSNKEYQKWALERAIVSAKQLGDISRQKELERLLQPLHN